MGAAIYLYLKNMEEEDKKRAEELKKRRESGKWIYDELSKANSNKDLIKERILTDIRVDGSKLFDYFYLFEEQYTKYTSRYESFIEEDSINKHIMNNVFEKMQIEGTINEQSLNRIYLLVLRGDINQNSELRSTYNYNNLSIKKQNRINSIVDWYVENVYEVQMHNMMKRTDGIMKSKKL